MNLFNKSIYKQEKTMKQTSNRWWFIHKKIKPLAMMCIKIIKQYMDKYMIKSIDDIVIYTRILYSAIFV